MENQIEITKIIDAIEKEGQKEYVKLSTDMPNVFNELSKYPFLYGYLIAGIIKHFEYK